MGKVLLQCRLDTLCQPCCARPAVVIKKAAAKRRMYFFVIAIFVLRFIVLQKYKVFFKNKSF